MYGKHLFLSANKTSTHQQYVTLDFLTKLTMGTNLN